MRAFTVTPFTSALQSLASPTPNRVIYYLEDFERAISEVKGQLDHRYLNEIEGLEVQTLERIAKWIWAKIEGRRPGLIEVRRRRRHADKALFVPAAGKGGLPIRGVR